MTYRKYALFTALSLFATTAAARAASVTLVYEDASQKRVTCNADLKSVESDPWKVELQIPRSETAAFKKVPKVLGGEEYGVLRLMADTEKSREPYALVDKAGTVLPGLFERAEIRVSREGKILGVSAVIKEQKTTDRRPSSLDSGEARRVLYTINPKNPWEPRRYWDMVLRDTRKSLRK